ncbi:transcription factor bHLH77-like [Pyrus ussuriensis x Pyrus communis]|uniref:Transcription factor bHLH77-like n=1 Tax=Pyrus ussuriensis x Pyrus communis TaxID=2448454 RepID=A0A5N5FQC0_9ROSA|nr:transcription factor bHLH77-like [Pyrus ussuriensis x Pyrus communis]
MIVGRKNDGKGGLFRFLLKPSLPLSSHRPHKNDTDGLASILSSSHRRLPSLAYVVLLHRLRHGGPCVVFWVGISDFKGERGCASFRSDRASMIRLDRGDGDNARAICKDLIFNVNASENGVMCVVKRVKLHDFQLLMSVYSAGKRVKLAGSSNENGSLKAEVEETLAAGDNKPAEESSKPSEPPKQDYIHVRARRRGDISLQGTLSNRTQSKRTFATLKNIMWTPSSKAADADLSQRRRQISTKQPILAGDRDLVCKVSEAGEVSKDVTNFMKSFAVEVPVQKSENATSGG